MSDTELGPLLGLVLHDLRNPLATLAASVRYVQRADANDPEIGEALDDCERAIERIARGFDQLGWIAHGPVADVVVEDVRETLRRVLDGLEAPVPLVVPEQPVERRAGEPLQHLVEILVRTAQQSGKRVRVQLSEDGVISVIDDGRAAPEEVRDEAFTVSGQEALRKAAYPRYAKVAGNVAAQALADALDATLSLDGADGEAVARVVLATPT